MAPRSARPAPSGARNLTLDCRTKIAILTGRHNKRPPRDGPRNGREITLNVGAFKMASTVAQVAPERWQEMERDFWTMRLAQELRVSRALRAFGKAEFAAGQAVAAGEARW